MDYMYLQFSICIKKINELIDKKKKNKKFGFYITQNI